MRRGCEPQQDRMFDAFREIYERSLELVDEVSPKSGLLPLSEILGPLQTQIEARRQSFCARSRDLETRLCGSAASADSTDGVGLNTVGMLSDRLSILAIKQHRLRSGIDGTAKSEALFQTQSLDILAALARVRPGNSALNTKITTLPSDAAASGWADAYFGLLSTNLLLWEAQEILYLKDILSLPAEELRGYIQWFAIGNMRRNRYIELCELLFWHKAAAAELP